ncbi:MAG: MerR family transcriptional regulator [Planctomycetes bacterium]|nr:MerR family transcriptional regulator [Planctomycetota bacterium]
MYTVKQVAEIMDISPYTLRFYDNEGLIPTLGRDNNRRAFTAHDMEWIYLIKCLRSTGLSLAEIREYVDKWREGDDTVEERHAIILRQKQKVEKELEFIKRQLEDLEKKLAHYEALKKGKRKAGTYTQRVQELIASHNRKDSAERKPAKKRSARNGKYI